MYFFLTPRFFMTLGLACAFMTLGPACALAPPVFAQSEGTARVAQSEGSVWYEAVTDLTSSIPEDMPAELRDLFPRELRSKALLRFSGSAAIFETQVVDPSGRVVSISVQDEVPVSFVDVATGRQVQQRKVLDRLFLLESELEPIAWRLTGESSTFLGYHVQQAVADHNDSLVEAWFAPQIPVSVGPDGYHGLPGLILLVTEDGGERTITAQEVSLGPLAAAIAPPTEGRRATLEQIERMIEERRRAEEADGPTTFRSNRP